MERARHRKWKSASGIEGTQQVQKLRAVPQLSSSTGHYIDGSSRDHMFMHRSGHNSLGPVTGIPMKKLLAEEMSKEVEPTSSPSLIAKLMGLEMMPPPRCVCRQQKRFLDSHQKKDVSVNVHKVSRQHDDQSSRRGLILQRAFKDIYEDQEASHVVNQSCSSRWNTRSTHTKPEMALVRQNFVDAKCLSTKEKLQDSKEFDDTLEMLHSNKDFLLNLLEQGSLFEDNKHYPPASFGGSPSNHIAVLRPSNSVKYKNKAKAWRSQEDNLNNCHSSSCLKHDDDHLIEPHSLYKTHISQCSSRFQVEDMTKVVILKPNLIKMENPNASGWSPGLPHCCPSSCGIDKEYQRIGGAEQLSRASKDSHCIGFSIPLSEEAREISKEIMMRVRTGCDVTESVGLSTAFSGYLGDESSCDNESDSESDSEVFKSPSRKSFHDEPSANTEASKPLCERWKVAHKYQALEMVRQSSTLGEMLALPDMETGSHHFNVETSCGRPRNRLGCNFNSGHVTWSDPLGISSRDGWKGDVTKNLSRSRSHSPSMVGRRPQKSKHHNVLTKDKSVLQSGSGLCSRSKAVERNQGCKECDLSNDTQSQSKKCLANQHIFIHRIDSSSEANVELQMKVNIKDLSEQQSTFHSAADVNICRSPVFDSVMTAKPESMALKPFESLAEQFSSITDGDASSVHDQNDSYIQEPPKRTSLQSSSVQCLGTEPDPTAISKEADHSSPVSVLDVPLAECTSSSSESFERVSAELHELRMQLQLLKVETDECADEPPLLPTKEQMAQQSQIMATIPKENLTVGSEIWQKSYTNDVLMNSGLQELDLYVLGITWHSPDSPLDPKLFDNLEKKYNHDTSGMRSDRRLLFDQIKSAIQKILEERIGSYPWNVPGLGVLHLKRKEGVGDVLERLMKQEFGKEGDKLDRTGQGELQWLESRNETEAVANKIEELLVDDLIAEVVYF